MNAEQTAAATSTAPHIVVAAGAGAGKTRTLIARIHHLIASGIKPADIAVITYTNAAANEIVRRLNNRPVTMADLAGPQDASVRPVYRLGYCGTLHGFMLRLLRQLGNKIGLPRDLSVVSEAQRLEILSDVVLEMGWKGSEKAAAEAIKVNPLLNRAGKPPGLPKAMLLAASYHRRMLENGLLDFDSILAYGRTVLDFAEPMVAPLGKHLLVDEFQDASDADDAIYEALPIANKFFVGDPDQSIYGFRGGNPQNFMRRAAMPGTALFYLEKNFRCGVQICAAANLLILNNRDRLPKHTTPVAVHDSSCVKLVAAKDEAAELAGLTQALASMDGLSSGAGVAVLCRTNAQARRIADHLTGCGIPVAQKAARQDPPDWPLVRQYIALLCNPDNDLLAYQWLKGVGGEDAAKAAQRKALAKLTTINRAGQYWTTPTLAALPDALAKQSGGWREAIERVRACMAELPEGSGIAELALALAQDDPRGEETGSGVVVTTLHSAKGREWDVVFLPGWFECNVPLKNNDEAEERRLAFVGVTRAKQSLIVSYPKEVCSPWTGEVEQTTPSRFIKEAGL
jgi:DNA helicase-2/ATP-dependent DNA helicase PcrA